MDGSLCPPAVLNGSLHSMRESVEPSSWLVVRPSSHQPQNPVESGNSYTPTLGLQARVHGVRYPKEACEALAAAGVAYAGWVPNYKVPQVFARFRITVHI